MPAWLQILLLGACFLLGAWLGKRRRRPARADLLIARVKYAGNDRVNYWITCRLCEARWLLVNVDIHRLDKAWTTCIRCGATERITDMQRALRSSLRVSIDDPPRHIEIREPQ